MVVTKECQQQWTNQREYQQRESQQMTTKQ